jgi:HK97 family phage portal protein
MKIFGLEIRRTKALAPSSASPIPYNGRGWRTIFEPFSGAWQQNMEETVTTLNTYPTTYAAISRISADIGMLQFQLIESDDDGIYRPVKNSAYSSVLRKQNSFQTQNQFRESWASSKLLQGNTYVLKSRDSRGVVNGLFVIDPEMVTPMITPSGQVFYQIQSNQINNLGRIPSEGITLPASEIIHDRAVCMFHPLVGISPLAAAYLPTLKNTKILKRGIEEYGTKRPFGILTGPAAMSDDDATKAAEWFNKHWPGFDVAAIGADLSFTPFAGKATDSQMVEQMKYSDEQICQAFGVPPFKISIGAMPSGMTVDQLNLLYYTNALQPLIEHMELLLTEGLGISDPLSVHLDTSLLLRMDEKTKVDIAAKEVASMLATPNEGRRMRNRSRAAGGDVLFGQMQDIPLSLLAGRNSIDNTPVAANGGDNETVDDETRTLAVRGAVMKRMQEIYS